MAAAAPLFGEARRGPDRDGAVLPAVARTLAAYFFLVLYVLLVGPPALLIARLSGRPDVLYRAGTLGVQVAVWLVGIRWVVEGREHLQTHRAAVYCVNHTSNLEPPVLFLVLAPLFPRLRILYKAELRRLPILTRGFDLAGFVPIERTRREQAVASIDRAAQALRDGYSFLVFPEGTRSPSGVLLPFKKGGFILAIKGQAPVVPMAISGARGAMRKGSFVIRPVTVRVRLAPPIETAGLTLADRETLTARVRAEIERLLTGADETSPAESPAAADRRGSMRPERTFSATHREP